MNRFLIEFKAYSPVTSKQMLNRRIVSAISASKAIEAFVSMGYKEDDIIRIWEEALTRRKTVNYGDLRKPD
jgi:Holliday junction resolvasome RuvABC DNA-binding subunit